MEPTVLRNRTRLPQSCPSGLQFCLLTRVLPSWSVEGYAVRPEMRGAEAKFTQRAYFTPEWPLHRLPRLHEA